MNRNNFSCQTINYQCMNLEAQVTAMHAVTSFYNKKILDGIGKRND